jgi:hypothetical protein
MPQALAKVSLARDARGQSSAKTLFGAVDCLDAPKEMLLQFSVLAKHGPLALFADGPSRQAVLCRFTT